MIISPLRKIIYSYHRKEENAMETQVYLASDIQKVLGLGKTKTYDFLNQVYKQQGQNPPFRVIKVGTSVRVHKQSFDDWLKTAAN